MEERERGRRDGYSALSGPKEKSEFGTREMT